MADDKNDRYGDRAAGTPQQAGKGRVQQARKAHHDSSTNADGSSFVEPLSKAPTSGGMTDVGGEARLRRILSGQDRGSKK